MKKLLTVTALVLVALFAVQANAQAADVTIQIVDFYDWGSVYNYQDQGSGDYAWTPIYPNPYYGTTSHSLYEDTYTTADGNEDSFAVGKVASISGGIYNQLLDGYEITTMFYGLDDVMVDGLTDGGAPKDQNIWSTAGKVLVYKDTTPDYVPYSPDPTSADRTGAAEFTNVTDGELLLELTGHLMYMDGDAAKPYSYSSTLHYNADSQTYTSVDAFMMFDVTGGAWADSWDTNTLIDGSDVVFSITGASVASYGENGAWVLEGRTGTGDANVIPEPASMSLIGMGLLSMLGIIKRRK